MTNDEIEVIADEVLKSTTRSHVRAAAQLAAWVKTELAKRKLPDAEWSLAEDETLP